MNNLDAEIEAVKAHRKPVWRSCGNCDHCHSASESLAYCAKIQRWVVRQNDSECDLFELRSVADPEAAEFCVDHALQRANAACGRCGKTGPGCRGCPWSGMRALLAGAREAMMEMHGQI